MALSKFLDPKNNYTFRRIFGTEKNKDILIHFLNDILGRTGEAKIEDVAFLSPIQDPEIAAKKESIVDVLCRDSTGVRFICEVQVARTSGFEKRAQFYASKAYSSQAGVGDQYQNLKEVIFIAITDFILFSHKSAYKSDHVILDKVTYEHDLKDFSFTFIELPKFPKTKEDQLENIVEKWCYFFKYASETSEKDLRKIVGSDVIIGKAYNELVGYNWTKEEQAMYEWIKKNEDDNVSCLKQKLNEGILIGHEKGKIEGKIEVAKNSLKAGVSIDVIAQITGLSLDEIQKLRN
ncbi:Rpn family recombination-promoting nuclease/putative transposase [Wolbachia endosymbiont (group A) of Agelastica alni]|uniref:Rpn family recombination-promoting nuclease/putative transposase n=1 Tax=Wolbachia endosymbiont (group A) of Agelastica alni TaxID=3066130 RepID=UPI00334053CC